SPRSGSSRAASASLADFSRACDDPEVRSRPTSFLPALLLALCSFFPTSSPLAAPLEDTLGRNETRVLSEPFVVLSGASVRDQALDVRLERLGYERVRVRPSKPGEYFHGNDVYWFYRRACRLRGRDYPAEL